MTSTHPNLADLSALAAEEPFVRALARGLLGGDEAAADDVVQQTWLEVLRNRVPEGSARRGFLARVVKSRASNLRRGDARRAARERDAARPEPVVAPDELLSRAEQRRAVVDAVAALAEPYRTVVLLRYFESLPPRAIASRLGVPRATVATRLKRGLALLRERFDGAHGGDRSAWIAALAPLALPVRGSAGVGALIANLFGLWAGLSAMKHILILLGAAVALALFFSSRDPRGSIRPPAAPATSADARAVAGALRDGAEPTPVAPADVVRQPLAAGPGHAATGIDPMETAGARVLGRAVLPDGSPATGRACRLWAFDPLTGYGGGSDPLGEPREAGPTWVDAVTDGDGRFAFVRVPPGGAHALWLAHGTRHATWRSIPQTPGPGQQLDLGTLVLDLRGGIQGTVVGPDGEPVTDAEVWAADLPAAVLAALPVDRLDPDGALLIGVPPLDGEPDAADWSDRMRAQLSSWLPQAEADGAFQVLPIPAWAARLVRELPRAIARTDAEGRFELEGVAPGANVVVVRAPGLPGTVLPRVPVRMGQVREVGRVRLRDGDAIDLRVVDAAGAAVAGAEVRVALRPRIGVTGVLLGSPARHSAADGRVTFPGLPRGEFVVAFRAGDSAPWLCRGPIEAGESVELRLPPTVDVRVVVRRSDGRVPEAVVWRLRQGPPLGELTATGFQPSLDGGQQVDDPEFDGGVPDEGARVLLLRDLPDGLYTLVVGARDAAIEAMAFTVAEGVTAELEVELEPAVQCAVEVVDADARPVAGAELWFESDREASAGWAGPLLQGYGGVDGFRRLPRFVGASDRDGRARVEHVRPGPATLIVRHPAFGATRVPVEAAEDGVRAVLQAPGGIRGRLTENGVAPAEGRYELIFHRVGDGAQLPDAERRARPEADGSFDFDGVPAGPCRVSVRARDGGPSSFGELLTALRPQSSWGIALEPGVQVEVLASQVVDVRLDADPLAPAAGDPGLPLIGRAALDGVPVVGAQITASLRFDSILSFDHPIAETDADGRFARPQPTRRDGTTVTLSAGDDALGFAWSRTLADAGHAELSFESPSSTVRIRAIGFDGLPAADHEVRMHGEVTVGGRLQANAITGPDGVAVLRVPAGDYLLTVEGARGSVTLPEPVGAGGRWERELRLGAAGVVAGRIETRVGESVSTVILVPTDRSAFWVQSVQADGRFVFTGIPAGPHEFTLHTGAGPRYAEPRSVEVGPDGAVDLALRVGGRLDDDR